MRESSLIVAFGLIVNDRLQARSTDFADSATL